MRRAPEAVAALAPGGRKKDEDDMAFGRRCFLLARNMLTPDGGTLGMNIKRKTGIHR